MRAYASLVDWNVLGRAKAFFRQINQTGASIWPILQNHSKRNSAGYWALRGLAVWALTVSAHASVTPDSLERVSDQRHARLETFFQSFGCPAPYHVREYLGAADTYDIDYRLLPAISVLESTCGIYQRENNRWGWASARKGFASFRAGIGIYRASACRGPLLQEQDAGRKSSHV